MNNESLPFAIDSVKGLGASIAIRRYELHMTQNRVAELAGISLRSLKQIEAGQTNPGIQPLLRVLYVLGLQMILDKRFANENKAS